MTARYIAYFDVGPQLHVVGSADGGLGSVRPIGTFTPSWEEVRSAADRIRGLVHHAADAGEMTASTAGELEDLCGYLFDELVPLPAKRWLREGEGPLTLSIPRALVDVPWELLHTGDDYLCLRWDVGRLLQRDEDPPTRVPRAGPPSVLIVADPDGGLAEAYDEGMALRRRLQEISGVTVAFRAGEVDAAYLRRHARAARMLHFAGHIDAGGWRMSGSTFTERDVERLAGGSAVPALVFANGCAGAAGGHERLGTSLAWLRAGTQHVLAPLFDVPDRLARMFAVHFYAELAGGATVGASVRRARRAVAAACGPGTTPWGAYVLYGDPSATVVGATRAAEPERPAPPATRLRPSSSAPAAEATRAPADPAAPARAAGDPVFVALVLAVVGAAAAAIAWALRLAPP